MSLARFLHIEIKIFKSFTSCAPATTIKKNVIQKACDSSKDVRSERINLTKHVHDIYRKMFNSLSKEVRNLYKWRGIPCPWIRRLNIII